jgi:HK97 gp10 family phage protein
MAVQQTTVTIDGLNQLRRAFKTLSENAKEDFKAAGYASASIVADEAKSLVPVVSGRLRDSIRAAMIETGGKVRAGVKAVPYAGPIHFGWGRRNITPQPFLYQAIDRRHGEVLDTYLAHLERITSGFCAPASSPGPKARRAAAKTGTRRTQQDWDKIIEAGMSKAYGQ